MGLSKRYTAARAWREVIMTLGLDVPDVLDFQALDILERSLYTVVGTFFDLLKPLYMAATTAQGSTTSRYFSSAGSYTAATKTLAATMSSSFDASDVNNLIVFRRSGQSYAATIKQVVSATSVIVDGNNLPAADLSALDAVEMVATAISADSVNLQNLSIASFGALLSVSIESSLCPSVDIIPIEVFKNWDPNANANKNAIVAAPEGTTFYFNRGKNLANYGTLVFHYPRVPDAPNNTDNLDLPDGPAVDLLIIRAMVLAAPRYRRDLPATLKDDTKGIIQNLLRSFGTDYQMKVIEEKAKAILA